MTGFKKYDEDKAPLDLLPPLGLWEIANAFAAGAAKYDPDNWRKGTGWRRYAGAGLRHIIAWVTGESIDPGSGVHHLACAAASCMMLLELELTQTGTDDRVKLPGELLTRLQMKTKKVVESAKAQRR